jgi:hypothetical protein
MASPARRSRSRCRLPDSTCPRTIVHPASIRCWRSAADGAYLRPPLALRKLRRVADYNYERFDLYVESGEDMREFGAFPNVLHAGERAPDGVLCTLDGEHVRLSDLWETTGVMLEFGSFT